MQEKKREKFEKEILDEKSFCLLVFHPLDWSNGQELEKEGEGDKWGEKLAHQYTMLYTTLQHCYPL
jgi:hypothetical protein